MSLQERLYLSQDHEQQTMADDGETGFLTGEALVQLEATNKGLDFHVSVFERYFNPVLSLLHMLAYSPPSVA